jgi:hypothetical protein
LQEQIGKANDAIERRAKFMNDDVHRFGFDFLQFSLLRKVVQNDK